MIRYPLLNQTTICPYFLFYIYIYIYIYIYFKDLSLSMRIEKIFTYFNNNKKNLSFLNIEEFISKITCPSIKSTFSLEKYYVHNIFTAIHNKILSGRFRKKLEPITTYHVRFNMKIL